MKNKQIYIFLFEAILSEDLTNNQRNILLSKNEDLCTIHEKEISRNRIPILIECHVIGFLWTSRCAGFNNEVIGALAIGAKSKLLYLSKTIYRN